jgi:O-antigen/teichoic acid export membrane protein
MLGTVFSQGLAFVSMIMIARCFGKEFLGEFGLVKSTIITLTLYAGLGIGMTTTKYISEFLLMDKNRVGRIIALGYLITLTLGGIFSIVTFLFASWISAVIINVPDLENTIRLSALWLFFITISGLQNGVLCGFQDFKNIAKTNIIIGLLTIPLLLGGGYFGGIFGIVSGFLIATLLNIIMNGFFINTNKKKYNITCDFMHCLYEFRILTAFSLPISMSSFLYGNVMWICYLLLKRQPDGLSEVAIMVVCMQVYNFSTYFVAQTWRVFVTMLSEQFGTRNEKSFWKTIKTSLFINVGSNLVIVILFFLFSSQFMNIYGKTFENGTPALITILIASFFMSLNSVAELIFQCRQHQWITFILTCIWSCIVIATTYFLLSYGLGALGMSIGFLSGLVVQFLCSYLILSLLYKKHYKNVVVNTD